MPFTFAHPAIILPLHFLPNKWFSFTALVIGSMTPDFEYFIRMKPISEYSHTIEGLFFFDLPVGILLTFIFHNLVRNLFIRNLPEFLRSRFASANYFNWNDYFKKNWIVVITSILMGASSHIFWDSFTHETGYFVIQIEFLKSILHIQHWNIPVYKILQHGSTLLGTVLILLVILNKKRTPHSLRATRHYWLIISIIVFFILSARLLLGLDFRWYGHVIVSALSAFMLAIIITPLLLRKRL